MLFLMVSEGL